MSQARTTELLENTSGNKGSETITDTLEHTGSFFWINVLAETVIAAITLETKETGNTLVGATLPAGYSGPLHCSSITLTSGIVRMAKK